jgi:hypothetical protein
MSSEGLRARKSTPLPQLGVLCSTVGAISLKKFERHELVNVRNGSYRLYALADATRRRQ